MVMHKVSATPREAGAVQAMLLMLAALLPIMGTLTMLPVMPLLFSHFAAQPHAQLLVPMIITIPAASMALLAPLAGMVGDRLSRRRLLIAATALYAGFGLLPVMLDDLYAILLARLVMGIADAFILTTANALIGDYFTGEARSKWLAVQSGIGSILSTLIVLGAGLLGTLGWYGPIYLYALAIPVFIGLCLFTAEPATRRRVDSVAGEEAVAFPRRKMAAIGLITLASAILYFLEPLQISQVFSQLGLTSSSQIGIATAVAGAAPGDGDRHLAHLLFPRHVHQPGSDDLAEWHDRQHAGQPAAVCAADAGYRRRDGYRQRPDGGPPRAGSLISPDDIITTRPPVFRREGEAII